MQVGLGFLDGQKRVDDGVLLPAQGERFQQEPEVENVGRTR
jgi:hypothetical protein